MSRIRFTTSPVFRAAARHLTSWLVLSAFFTASWAIWLDSLIWRLISWIEAERSSAAEANAVDCELVCSAVVDISLAVVVAEATRSTTPRILASKLSASCIICWHFLSSCTPIATSQETLRTSPA